MILYQDWWIIMPMQQGRLPLTALSHLRLDAMISQGPALGKGTPADQPKLGRWVAGILTTIL